VIPLSSSTLYIAGVSKEPPEARIDPAQLADRYRSRFAEFGGIAAELLDQVRRPEQVVYTAIEEMHLPRPWFSGRVVVMGDAAHASTPFWSQGGAMAVEDAVLLARRLEREQAVAPALASWMDLRYERCMFVQRGSFQTGSRMHDDALAPEARLDYIRNRLQADLDRRLAVLEKDFDDENQLLSRSTA
jgi:2-polyprenyl-6-methoxyphenol hydroxylase-like FAD-dependent oxidoreductase